MALVGYCTECGQAMILTIFSRVPPLCEKCEKKSKEPPAEEQKGGEKDLSK